MKLSQGPVGEVYMQLNYTYSQPDQTKFNVKPTICFLHTALFRDSNAACVLPGKRSAHPVSMSILGQIRKYHCTLPTRYTCLNQKLTYNTHHTVLQRRA